MKKMPERKGLIARLEPRWLIETDSPEHAAQSLIEGLIDRLRDPSPAVRGRALTRLIDMGAASVPALIAALRSDEAAIWTTAAGALVKIGSPAVSPLLDVLHLKRESEAVQMLVLEVLSQIGDPRAIDLFIETLESESSPLQTVAAVALTRMGEAAVEPLLKAAHEAHSPQMRQVVTSILERIGTSKALAAVSAWRAIDDLLG